MTTRPPKEIEAGLLHAGDKILTWSARRRAGVPRTIKRVTGDPTTVTLWYTDGGRDTLPRGQKVSLP